MGVLALRDFDKRVHTFQEFPVPLLSAGRREAVPVRCTQVFTKQAPS
jgi:hypothetical protein